MNFLLASQKKNLLQGAYCHWRTTRLQAFLLTTQPAAIAEPYVVHPYKKQIFSKFSHLLQ